MGKLTLFKNHVRTILQQTLFISLTRASYVSAPQLICHVLPRLFTPSSVSVSGPSSSSAPAPHPPPPHPSVIGMNNYFATHPQNISVSEIHSLFPYFCGSFLPFWIRIRIPNLQPIRIRNIAKYHSCVFRVKYSHARKKCIGIPSQNQVEAD